MVGTPLPLAFGFVTPLWLWALAGMAIPVAIHLWRRQTPRIERWAAMQFLRSALEQHSRRLRWESLLLLLVRCALLALLALAVAEPFRESESVALSGAKRTHRVLLIDGSLSMSAKSGTHSRFEATLQQAREIVRHSTAGDSFQLCRIGNATSPVIIRRPAHDSSDVLREIDSLPPMDDAGDVAGALRQLSDLLTEIPRDQNCEIYIFSDFQTTNWSGVTPSEEAQVRQLMSDLAARGSLFLVSPGGTLPANVAVQSVHVPELVAISGRPFRVEVGLASFSGSEEKQTLEILTDQVVRSTQPVVLSPWGTQTISSSVSIPETGEGVVIEARITPDAMTADNQSRRVVASRRSLEILLVDGHPSDSLAESATGFLQLAIAPPPTASSAGPPERIPFQPQVCSIAELSQVDFQKFDGVVLSDVSGLGEVDLQRLNEYVTAGGGLLVGLGEHTDREEFQRTLGASLIPAELLEFADHLSEPVTFETRELTHAVLAPFRGRVDSGFANAPISRYAKMKPRPEGSWQVILPYTTGDPAILERSQGRGRVVLVTTSLNDRWGHWVLWPSYVPLMNRLLQHSIEGRLRSDPLVVGTPIRQSFPQPVDGEIVLPTNTSVAALVENQGAETILSWPKTGQAGIYQVVAGPPFNQRVAVAVNPDPRESDPRSLNQSSLRNGLLAGIPFEWVTDTRAISHAAVASNQGRTTLSRFLLWGVLALLLIELILVWRFRWGVVALGGVAACGLLMWWAT